MVVEVVARWERLKRMDALPLYEQQLAALEALQVYAPLGHALGLGPVSAQMEDLCFKVGGSAGPLGRWAAGLVDGQGMLPGMPGAGCLAAAASGDNA